MTYEQAQRLAREKGVRGPLYAVVADELWPQVERELSRLRAHRGLIGAGLATLGLGAGVAAHGYRRETTRRPGGRG